MLEIDYRIERDEGDGTAEYVPNPAVREMNGPIVCFQAPNGKGKSTMLNIMSSAFYGNKDDKEAHRISPSLQKKVTKLLGRSDQKLFFDIQLTSPDGKIKLHSRKESNKNDIIVEETVDGVKKQLPFPTFKEKYFLIYDIPENPVEKLKDITTEVLTKQNSYKTKLVGFRDYISKIQTEIANAYDEEKVKEAKAEVDRRNDEKDEAYDLSNLIKQKRDIITKYYALTAYHQCAEKISEIDDQLSDIDDELSSKTIKVERKKQKSNATKTKVEQNLNQIKAKTKLLQDTLVNVGKPVFSKCKKELDYIQKTGINEVIDSGKYDIESVKKVFNSVDKHVQDLLNNEDLVKAGINNEFYNDILTILNRYKKQNVSIPGTDASLEILITKISEAVDENRDKVRLVDSLMSCHNEIQEGLNILPVFEKNVYELRLISDDDGSYETSVSETDVVNAKFQRKNELMRKFDVLKRERSSLEKMLLEMNIPLADYKRKEDRDLTLEKLKKENHEYQYKFELPLNNLKEEVDRVEKEYVSSNAEYEKKRKAAERAEADLERYENAEPHKYQKYIDLIDRINRVSLVLDGKLKKFNTTIDNIANDVPLTTNDEIKYNNTLSIYLARRIPEFPYNGTYYHTEKIDLSNKVISTQEKKIIKTDDISTGQGMSMYIRSLLSDDTKSNRNRKYIVIFDEAHTMDRTSFKPIKEALIKMKDENRLMFALFVKPNSDAFKVLDLK